MTRTLSVRLAAEIDQKLKSAYCRILFYLLLFMLVLSHTVTFIVITSHKYVSLDHQENDNQRREAVQRTPRSGVSSIKLVDHLEENHPERPGGHQDEDNGGGRALPGDGGGGLPTTILPA